MTLARVSAAASICLAFFALSCDRDRSNPLDPQFDLVADLPATPAQIKADAGVGVIRVAWQSVTDTDLAGYAIYRASQSNGTYRFVAGDGDSTAQITTGKTTFADTVGQAATFFYRVAAVDTAGLRGELSVFAGATALEDAVAPGAPHRLSVVPDESTIGRVTLRWSAPQRDADGRDLSGLAGYVILRADEAAGGIAPVDTVGADTRQFIDIGLKSLTTYSYSVIAFDALGNASQAASVVQVTTAGLATPTGLTVNDDVGRVVLNWRSVDDAALVGYDVYRSSRSDTGYVRIAGSEGAAFTTGRTTLTDSSLVADELAYYRVQAIGRDGVSSELSAFVSGEAEADETAPGVPRSLSAVAAEGASQINVGWSAPLSDVDGGDLTGLSGYVLLRAEGASGSLLPVDTLAADVRDYLDADLKALTAYAYALLAFDEAGNQGPQASSTPTTTAGVPRPAGVRAAGGIGRITLTWTPVDDSDLAGYDVFRATGSDGTYLRRTGMEGGPLTTGRTAYIDSNLTGGSLFFYKVQAVGSNGLRSEMSTFASGEAQADESAPGQARNVSAVADEDDSGRISVGWSAPATDVGGDALTGLAGYVLLRAEGSDGAFLLVDSLTADTRQYVDAGLRALTDYRYALYAYDDSGNEGSQVLSNVTRTAGLPTPVALRAGDGIERITLRWASVEDDDLAGYDLYRASTSDGNFQRLTGNEGTSFTTGRTTFVDSGLTAGDLFFYKVQAIGGNGLTSGLSGFASGQALADGSAPGRPQNVSALASQTEIDQVTIRWTAPTADAEGEDLSGLAGFRILRSDAGASLATVATLGTDDRQYDDSGLRSLTDYSYAVVAFDSAGNESQLSSTASTTTIGVPAPGGLAAEEGTERITLTWRSVAEDDLIGYNVYRSSESDDNYVQLSGDGKADYTTGRTSYIDSTLPAGSLVFYRVSTVTSAFESGRSGFVSASADADTIVALDGIAASGGINKITVLWSAAEAKDLEGYNVYRSTQSDGSYTRQSGVEGTDHTTGQTSFVDSGLVGGQVFFYRVSVVTAAGDSERSDFAGATVQSDTRPPAAPVDGEGESVTDNPEALILTWTAPRTDSGGSELTGVASYIIYRSDSATGSFTEVGTSSSAQFQDSDLEAKTTYYYEIEALDAAGNVGPRSSVTAVATAGVGVPSEVRLVSTTPSSAGDPPVVTISWDASSGAIVRYEVERTQVADSSADSDYTDVLPNSLQTTRTDNTVTRGQTYYYRVRAVDVESRESDWTVPLSIDVSN